MKKKEKKEKRHRSLVIGDTKYITHHTTKFENRKKWEKPNPKMIYSFIPGTILKINVKKGDNVKAGKELLVIEAMKMKNSIKIPFGGTIKKINIKKGQQIPKNYLMIEIK